MARKRSNSHLGDRAGQPKKIAKTKTKTISAATDTLSSANARIAELERQVQDLHAFIHAQGLTRGTYSSVGDPIGSET